MSYCQPIIFITTRPRPVCFKTMKIIFRVISSQVPRLKIKHQQLQYPLHGNIRPYEHHPDYHRNLHCRLCSHPRVEMAQRLLSLDTLPNKLHHIYQTHACHPTRRRPRQWCLQVSFHSHHRRMRQFKTRPMMQRCQRPQRHLNVCLWPSTKNVSHLGVSQRISRRARRQIQWRL